MQVREARADDVETLFEIRTSVKENYQSREEIAELGITPETVTQMLQADCRAWVAEIDGRAVGFSIASATEKTIFGLFVLPEFEGRGAGRALVGEAESWLRSQGIEEIWLTTENDPQYRAYGFYLHLGWTIVEERPDGEIKLIKKLIGDR